MKTYIVKRSNEYLDKYNIPPAGIKFPYLDYNNCFYGKPILWISRFEYLKIYKQVGKMVLDLGNITDKEIRLYKIYCKLSKI